MSRIEDAIAKRLQDRAAFGAQKYGVTMERTDLQFVDWLKHIQEELLDGAVYIEKVLEDFQKEGKEVSESYNKKVE